MALDFPSSPVHGQTYGNYTYDGYVGIWRSSSAGNGVVNTTTSAPTTATPGDLWFNPNDGTMYVYYNDGTSGQWVESRAPITADGYQSPNYIINGGMDIAQRGTSVTHSNAGTKWGLDRFALVRAGFAAGITSSQQSSGLPGFVNCLRLTRAVGDTNTAATWINQPMEISHASALMGKTVTMSFYARKGAGFSASSITAKIDSGTAETTPGATVPGYTVQGSADFVITTSWQRYSLTTTLSASLPFIQPTIAFTPTGTAPANDFLEITGVQLEEGSTATAFRRNANSIQGELAACQRYYFRTAAPGTGDDLCNGWVINSTTARVGLQFPVRMRTAPTALEQSNTASDYYVRTPASVIVCSAVPTWFGSTADFGSINLTVASGLTTGYGTTARAQTANAFFGWSAEL